MKNDVLTFIGLGSNLQNPEQQIKNAISFLHDLPSSTFLQCSSLYTTSPVGVENHPDYINAVVSLQTSLSADQLLGSLMGYEHKVGRHRAEGKVMPRPIDLDILLYGRDIISTESLQVPHPRMLERGFVLLPLSEIAPELELPTGEVLQLAVEAWKKQPKDRVERFVYG